MAHCKCLSAVFPISVKGVLELDRRYLLRQNEREEYELPGGRLERGDPSFAERLCTEFLEESGIAVRVGRPLEPWILQVGQSRVLIAPYRCQALHIPEILSDLDGGQLAWANAEDICRLPMPQGYRDSIFSLSPHSSLSRPAEDTRGWVKTGDEKRLPVFVQLWEKGELQKEQSLPLLLFPERAAAGNVGGKACRFPRLPGMPDRPRAGRCGTALCPK